MKEDQLKKIMDLVLGREKKLFEAAQSDIKELEKKLSDGFEIQIDAIHRRIDVVKEHVLDEIKKLDQKTMRQQVVIKESSSAHLDRIQAEVDERMDTLKETTQAQIQTLNKEITKQVQGLNYVQGEQRTQIDQLTDRIALLETERE
jgi:hypothetical protein